jgi:hypothetical protein
LLRAAMLAVADAHVRELFHSFCFTNLTAGAPMCVSDEHYLPSLLASYGLDRTTDCQVRSGCKIPNPSATWHKPPTAVPACVCHAPYAGLEAWCAAPCVSMMSTTCPHCWPAMAWTTPQLAG